MDRKKGEGLSFNRSKEWKKTDAFCVDPWLRRILFLVDIYLFY